MKSQCLLAASLLILVGCNRSPTPSTSQTASETPASIPTLETSVPTEAVPTVTPTASNPTPATPQALPTATPSTPTASQPTPSPLVSPTPSQKLSPPASKAVTISPDGIGSARVGMTVGELKKLLAGKDQFQVVSPFIVDFDAIAVSQSGEVQYYILYPAGSPLADSDLIEALITNNPKYRTAQGVGPGTSIQQAEAVYGDATLSYNLANESREYAKFAKQPAKNLSFRIGAANDNSLGGIYPMPKSELNQTKDYNKTALINFVEVYCGKTCPLPSPK
jgi:hypothetical protein